MSCNLRTRAESDYVGVKRFPYTHTLHFGKNLPLGFESQSSCCPAHGLACRSCILSASTSFSCSSTYSCKANVRLLTTDLLFLAPHLGLSDVLCDLPGPGLVSATGEGIGEAVLCFKMV